MFPSSTLKSEAGIFQIHPLRTLFRKALFSGVDEAPKKEKKISNSAGTVWTWSERENMTLHLPCQLLPSDWQRQVSLHPFLPPYSSVPSGESRKTCAATSKSAHTRTQETRTNTQTFCLTYKHTDAHTEPVAMHSDGSIEGFEVSSNVSLCRRYTASNKLFNPIISLSLFPLPQYNSLQPIRDFLRLAKGNDKKSEFISPPLFPEILLKLKFSFLTWRK